jgi:hypothetical protein
MTRRFAIAATASAAVVFALPGLAHAKYTAIAGSGSTTVAATTLHNATGLTPTCGQGSVKGVVLTWSPSSDSFAGGYTVYRKINTGAFVALATVNGGASTTYNDATAKNAIGGDTYAYTISAFVQNWVTGQSAAVSKSFSNPNGACVGP